MPGRRKLILEEKIKKDGLVIMTAGTQGSN